MRILFLGNNWVGWQVIKWLKEQNEQIVGAVVHPTEKQKYGDQILKCADLEPESIFIGSQINSHTVLKKIRALKPDIGLSALFDYILKPELLEIFPEGVVNLHPAYLPYNRGQYPNVWSIIDGTPAGVTLHYIDSSIDTGDIIAQCRVPIAPEDTGKALYRKLEKASLELFTQTWPLIKSGKTIRTSQNLNEGTFHYTKDVEQVDQIKLDHRYTARELIDIIRARTFPPYPGAFFIHNGNKIYLRLQLLKEDEIEGEQF